MADFDLAIVGGGINGTGVARDAAGRGLRTVLIEQNDLAAGTSSASSKLIHGGLRYLEHGEFRLVREALREREALLRAAPHLVRPMRFVLPTTGHGIKGPEIMRGALWVNDLLSADRLYERRWALTLIEQVIKRLKEEYRATGNALLFDSLKQLLPDEPEAPSRAEIAAKLGMTDNALRQAFHRFRHRYQTLLREEIGHTVSDPSEFEDELRHLIAVLRS